MAQWYSARMASIVKLPTIPFEIGIGLLFGPHGLDAIPKFSHDYTPLRLLGFIGVGLVIFESGMHLDIKKVFNWDIGPHVFVVACLGTFLPIGLGMGFMAALGSDIYPVSDQQYLSFNTYYFIIIFMFMFYPVV
jgi:Kef-type K+ transport system membrane component KefB